MTSEKLISVFDLYQAKLSSMGARAQKFRAVNYLLPTSRVNEKEVLGHLLYMCGEGTFLTLEGRIEKAMRWLGFLQGALWARDIYTLEELKNHSRPDTQEEV